jgi:hypothetical protein
MSYASEVLQVFFPSGFIAISKSPYPQEIPNVISPEDRNQLVAANRLDIKSRVMLYQEMIDRYSDSHPYLLVRLADLFVLLKSGTLAIDLYHKVKYFRLRPFQLNEPSAKPGSRHLIYYGNC